MIVKIHRKVITFKFVFFIALNHAVHFILCKTQLLLIFQHSKLSEIEVVADGCNFSVQEKTIKTYKQHKTQAMLLVLDCMIKSICIIVDVILYAPYASGIFLHCFLKWINPYPQDQLWHILQNLFKEG